MVITFKDKFHSPDKQKQLDSFRESHIEVNSIKELEEAINFYKQEKITILREQKDYIQFGKIIESEYPNLNIEVIPELYFKIPLKENEIPQPNQEQTSPLQPKQYTMQQQLSRPYVILDVADSLDIPIYRAVIPLSILSKSYFDKIKSEWIEGNSFLLLYDKPNGLWLGAIREMVQEYPGIDELFRKTQENSIPMMDIQAFTANYGVSVIDNIPNPNKKNHDLIINQINLIQETYKKSFELANKIYQDVKSNKVELNEEVVKTFTEANPKIGNIIKAIILNIELKAPPSGTVVKNMSEYLKSQSAMSKFIQTVGFDKDIQTGVENLNKGGLSLVTSAAQAMLKQNKDEQHQEVKTQKKSTEVTAFLCHKDCETLLKLIYEDYGKGFIKNE